jgi:hypothetical protein
MTTTTIDHPTSLLVLRLVANGKRAVDVATLAGADLDTVRRIAREHGYPDMSRIRRSIDTLENGPKSNGPALVPAAAVAGGCETDPATARGLILGKAKRSPKHTTRQLAARIEVLLADLTQRIDAEAAAAKAAAARDQQKEHARAQIAKLEAELAAAKAVLKGKPLAAASDHEPTAKMIRAWAAEHGLPCSTRGRVDRNVRDAYLAAHSAKAV